MTKVNPIMASDNPNLFPFNATVGKILIRQRGAVQLIMTRGSSMFYDNVATLMAGGDYSQLMPWFRHFIVPGNAHCGGGSAPQAQNLFQTVVNWVETGAAPPQPLPAVQSLTGGATRTRPVCPYPTAATYIGGGADPNQFASWVCQ